MSEYEEQYGPDGDVRVAMALGFVVLGTIVGSILAGIFFNGWAATGVVSLGLAVAVALYRSTEERDL